MVRSGRISNLERYYILQELGKIAQRIFNKNLEVRSTRENKRYNLNFIKDALKFESDPITFTNTYWVDVGSEDGNKIAAYYEYGTGLYNTKHRIIGRDYIRPKNYDFLHFINNDGKHIYTKAVKGVEGIHYFRRTMNTINKNEEYLIQRIRNELGI